MRPVSLGLLGCGTIGQSLLELLGRNKDLIAGRTGLQLGVRRVLVRDPRKERPLDPALLTTDPAAILDAQDVDIVVELMGGVDAARGHVARALRNRKSVVTANRSLMATCGRELLRLAAEQRVWLGFEGSVCGGLPILRALEAGLVGNRISMLVGIVTGATNFILTRMGEDRWSFARALVEAQRRGFAGADPAQDLDGQDSAQKLQLLAEIAFGVHLEGKRFPVEGIRFVEEEDLRSAEQLGFVVRHLAVAQEAGEALDLRVHPALLPMTHPLAHVREEFNSILVRGDAVDEMIFTGKGAGAMPTASAVLSDIIEIARDGSAEHGPTWHVPDKGDRPVASDLECRYYLRFPIKDVPGVIGTITTVLGGAGISISHAAATLAEGRPGQGNVKILAHRTKESALRRALGEIGKLPVLSGKPVILRIFEEG
jgi:homoserine dehydrogenase